MGVVVAQFMEVGRWCSASERGKQSPKPFRGVATPVVAVVDFLVLGPFVGAFAFAFAFVPLEDGEEGLLAVRRDGFFWGDSSSLLSALGLRRDTLGIVIVQLCARPCVFRRELRPPPQIED